LWRGEELHDEHEQQQRTNDADGDGEIGAGFGRAPEMLQGIANDSANRGTDSEQ
jgi:hypothetical protein